MLKDNKGTNIMKICPKCHHEFEDNVKFCKDCGTPLVDQLTCPNCGEPITVNDTFCGNCGHQLQEKKPTPKVEEVKVEEAPKQENKFLDTNKTIKGLSLFVLVTLLILSVLCFVGIFGQVLYHYSNTDGSVYTTSLGLNFYGDMFKDAHEASDYGYARFAATLYNLTAIQLLAFILAIIGVLCSFAIIIVFLVLIVKKNINLKEKFLYIPFAMIMLHPLMFCFSYYGKSIVENTTYQTITRLGWGTGMIFVSCIVAFSLLLFYSSLKRNFLQEQKDGKITTAYVVIELLHLALCVATVIIALLASSHIISMKIVQRDGGVTITARGHGAAMSDYLSYLANSDAGNMDMPKTAPLIGVGHSLLIFGFIGVLAFIVLMDNKKLAAPTIVGSISAILLAIAFTLSYIGESGAVTEIGGSSVPVDAVRYSGLAIATYILVPVTLFMGLLKKTQLESIKSAA